MKNLRKLIPAFAMLLISAILVSTSTYAWFSMNTTVTAQGMSVKAKAEQGLVIANADHAVYSNAANAKKDAVAQMYPGSTKDFSTWLHSVSTDPDAANTRQVYGAATEWADNTTNFGNYIDHTFYIRSSAAEALTVTSLDIKSVTVVVNEGSTAASAALNKALRVGVSYGSQNYFFSPLADNDTTTVSVQNAAGAYTDASGARTDVVSTKAITSTNEANFKNTGVTSIPSNTNTGVEVHVYIWYEGEDVNCKSNNIVSNLDKIEVTVVFGYTA